MASGLCPIWMDNVGPMDMVHVEPAWRNREAFVKYLLFLPGARELYLFITTACTLWHLQGTVLCCQTPPSWLWGGLNLHIVKVPQIWSQFRGAGLGSSSAPCLAGRTSLLCSMCSVHPQVLLKCKQMSLHGSATAALANKSNVTELAVISWSSAWSRVVHNESYSPLTALKRE